MWLSMCAAAITRREGGREGGKDEWSGHKRDRDEGREGEDSRETRMKGGRERTRETRMKGGRERTQERQG